MTLNTVLLEPFYSLGKVKLQQCRNYIPCFRLRMKNKKTLSPKPFSQTFSEMGLWDAVALLYLISYNKSVHVQ